MLFACSSANRLVTGSATVLVNNLCVNSSATGSITATVASASASATVPYSTGPRLGEREL